MIRGVIKGLGGLQKVFQIKRSVGALKLWMAGCQFSSSIQSLNQVTVLCFFCPAKFLSPSNAEHLDIYLWESRKEFAISYLWIWKILKCQWFVKVAPNWPENSSIQLQKEVRITYTTYTTLFDTSTHLCLTLCLHNALARHWFPFFSLCCALCCCFLCPQLLHMTWLPGCNNN